MQYKSFKQFLTEKIKMKKKISPLQRRVKLRQQHKKINRKIKPIQRHIKHGTSK